MTRAEWTERIRAACIEAGTYEEFFDMAIDQLAGILEMKNQAEEKFQEMGGEPVVESVNRAGGKNVRKNPALAAIMECNQQALAYWRDLGLTPSGYKKLDGVVSQKKDVLADLLQDLGA